MRACVCLATVFYALVLLHCDPAYSDLHWHTVVLESSTMQVPPWWHTNVSHRFSGTRAKTVCGISLRYSTIRQYARFKDCIVILKLKMCNWKLVPTTRDAVISSQVPVYLNWFIKMTGITSRCTITNIENMTTLLVMIRLCLTDVMMGLFLTDWSF